jgi:hypothetical protein
LPTGVHHAMDRTDDRTSAALNLHGLSPLGFRWALQHEQREPAVLGCPLT